MLFSLPVHQRLTRGDIVLIAGLLILVLASLPWAHSMIARAEGAMARIEVDGREFATVPLHQEQRLMVPGPLGTTEVVIQDHEAFVRASPCRAKICVKMGTVSQAGQMVVCVPNKVSVRILGTREQDVPYDAISR